MNFKLLMALKGQNMTSWQVALASKISSSRFSRILNFPEAVKPTKTEAQSIAKILGVPVNELFSEFQEEKK
ncbi:MAG: hypothetical protein SGJ18_04000 [Pseudomonadota bacterium]|nr:hypothetical protein [Pseudomonadota bacterium]